MERKIKLNRDTKTIVLIPKGELLPGLLTFLDKSGLAVKAVAELMYEIPSLGLPLLLLAMRPRDIGDLINTADNSYVFGITGSDIAEEDSLTSVQSLPQWANPYPTKIVVGSTPNFREKVTKPSVRTLAEIPGATIATPYPNLTGRWQKKQGLDLSIVKLMGGSERYYFGDQKNMAVVDVVRSGKTFKDYGISELDTIMPTVELTLVQPNKVDEVKSVTYKRDIEVVNKLLNRIKDQKRNRSI